MRKHLIYCTALICCFLTACGTSEAPLVNVNNSAEESVSSEISSADSNTDEDSLDDPFEGLDYDAFYGCGFEKGTDADGNPVMVDYDNIPVENNAINLTLSSRVQMKEQPAEGKCHAYMLMGINGQLYDFSVDGKASTNGILETDIPVNQDVRVPFEVKDLPAQSGYNTFAFYTVLTDFSTRSYAIMEYTGTFHADAANEGMQPVSLTAESALQNIETVSTDGKTQDEILNPNGGTIRMFDKDAVQSFDDTTGVCSLKQSTPIYYELVNANDDNGPSNRSGFCLALFNGKPLNIWNGSPLAAVSMKDNELLKRIPMTSDLKPGESGQIGCIYFDLSNGTGGLKTEQISENIIIAE